MAGARTATLLLAAVLLAAAASAQPCIECKDCVTQNCWRVCKDTCTPIRPSDIIVSGDQCRDVGTKLGTLASQVGAHSCAVAWRLASREAVGRWQHQRLAALAGVTSGTSFWRGSRKGGATHPMGGPPGPCGRHAWEMAATHMQPPCGAVTQLLFGPASSPPTSVAAAAAVCVPRVPTLSHLTCLRRLHPHGPPSAPAERVRDD